jgi:hypothetical protein
VTNKPHLDAPIMIDKFWRNPGGQAVVTRLYEYGDNILVDCRVHYTAPDGCLKPTRKGIAVLVNRLPELAAALAKAERIACELGLISKQDNP